MNNDINALYLFGYLFVTCMMLFIGLVITEVQNHNEKLARETGDQTDFQSDWLYRGLYENLLKHAESEAKKLDV